MDGPSQSTNPFESDWQHPSPNPFDPAPSYQQQSSVQSPPPPLQQPTATASNAWPARLVNESTSSPAHGDVHHAWSGTLHRPTNRVNQSAWSPIGETPLDESAYTAKTWADPNVGMNAYSMGPVSAQDDGYNIDPTKLLLAKPAEKPLSKWEQSRVRGRRCNDWPCAVIFLALLGVVLFFGIQGLRELISDPLDICDVLVMFRFLS